MPSSAAEADFAPEGVPISPQPAGRVRKPHSAAGVALVMLTAALWSLNGPLIKVLNAPREGNRGVSPLAIASYRSIIGGSILLPLAWRRRKSLGSTPPRWALFSVLTFTVMTFCFASATTKTAAANAIVL